MPTARIVSECRNARYGWSIQYVQFNLVGVFGFLVQLGSLALMYHVLGWHFLVSTLVSVGLAIVHNYAWHERWTWHGRSRDPLKERARRLSRFTLANGSVSLIGNVVLMHLLVRAAGLPVLLANCIAVISCSVVNFLLSREIFRTPQGDRSFTQPLPILSAQGKGPPTRSTTGAAPSIRNPCGEQPSLSGHPARQSPV